MKRLTQKNYLINGESEAYVYGGIENYGDSYGGEVIDKLAAYEDAEEQGLLLRLPCKVGDKVYTPCAWGIESGVVGSIEIISDRVFINNKYGAMIGEAHNVFLTKEEAEQMKGE